MTHESLNPREFILATETTGWFTQLAWKDDDGKFHWMFLTLTNLFVDYPWPEEHFMNVIKMFPEENICRFYMEP